MRLSSKAIAVLSAALLFVVMVAAMAILALAQVGLAGAQEPIGPWNEPQNLSLSAGTSEPVIVVDSAGGAHAIWKNGSSSFMYARMDNGAWTVARGVELPFGTRRYAPDLTERQETPLYTPVLWAGRNNEVHALWIDRDNRMFYSSVPSSGFATFEAWSVPQEIATSALTAAAVTDGAGRLHLVYIRPTTDSSAPSGIYYRGSTDGGVTWSASDLLYESPYFRSLRVPQTNLQITASSGDAVLAAWDNPFQERVYVARSGNAGQSWQQPVEVDRRQEADGADALGPHDIRLASSGDDVHVVWQAGHDGLLCTPYHQVSADRGETWQPAQRMMPQVETCSESSQLIGGNGASVIYMSPTEDGGYITAWDGVQWSAPQQRAGLTRFVNSTNYREVELGCHQVATGAADGQGGQDTAIIIGCDTGQGSDTWALSVNLGSLLEEIAPESTPIWQRPGVVSGPTRSDALRLLADADGWLHALWVQPLSGDGQESAVHYSRWDGLGWSQPKDLLSAPEINRAAQPAVTLSNDDKIMAVWLDEVPGAVYFSQADLARAGIASEWSSPIVLPMIASQASSPEIVIGPDGIIHVAYAKPLNEDRGIYLTQSADGGDSWFGPIKVFDGVAAGWSLVDTPRLAVGGDGTIHLMWTRWSSPPNSMPVSLHYARSTDGGESWSAAVEVAQAMGTWSDVIAGGDLGVHRIWMADNNDLWHQSSIDGGVSWGQPQRVSGAGNALPVAVSVLDRAGRPWLLQSAGTRNEAGEIGPPVELRNWVLAEGRWVSAEALPLGMSEIEELAAATTAGGELSILFADLARGLGLTEEGETLYHTSRNLDLPQVEPTPLPTLTPTPLPSATTTPTPAPMPTATPSFPTEAEQSGGLPLPIDTSNPLTGPLLGVIPAAIVVLIAFFIGIRLLRGDRRR